MSTNTSRVNTEPGTHRTATTGRGKGDKSMIKDKSVGKLKDGLADKGMGGKTKTTATIKTVKKDEGLSKTKSTLNLKEDSKTPKTPSKTIVKNPTKSALQTPTKKDLTKTQSTKKIEPADKKGLSKTPTVKNLAEKPTKPGLAKSNTKGELINTK